jgi:hypothetical protein
LIQLVREVGTYLAVPDIQICVGVRDRTFTTYTVVPPYPLIQLSAVYRGTKTRENYRNKQLMNFKTRAKRERALTWWNPAAQTCPVLDSSFFVPVPTLKRQNPLFSYVQERERESTL